MRRFQFYYKGKEISYNEVFELMKGQKKKKSNFTIFYVDDHEEIKIRMAFKGIEKVISVRVIADN